MRNVTLDLSQKAARFVLLSVDLQLDHWRKQFADEMLSEDEQSDVQNDLAFLGGVRAHLAEAIPKKPDES